MGVSLNGGFSPISHPQVLIIFSRKNPMGLLGETHHFRKPPHIDMGVSKNRGTPKRMVKWMIWLFLETPTYRPYCYKGPTFAPTPHPPLWPPVGFPTEVRQSRRTKAVPRKTSSWPREHSQIC